MTEHPEPDPAVAAEFRSFRRAARQAFPPPPPELLMAAGQRGPGRRTAATLVGVAVVLAVVAGTVLVRATTAGEAPPAPPAASGPGPTPAPAPGPLTGVRMGEPTGLRLLLPRWLVDVDAGTSQPVPVNGWLDRPGAEPLLFEWDWDGAYLGPVELTTGTAADLPGNPPLVRLNRDGIGTAAVSASRDGLWVVEGREPADCTLRELDLAGQQRRPPREFACDTRLTAETGYGLWVTEESLDGDTVLLDPDTLGERARYPAAVPVDDRRAIVTTDDWRTLELRDLATGEVRPVARPPAHGQLTASWVGPVSPDGRWLPVRFGDPSRARQVLDVWLLDLASAQWTHLPSMPAYAALKFTSLAWAGDGRLVLLGLFSIDGPGLEDARLATWRPGAPELAVRPFARPEADSDEPYTNAFLVR